MKKFFFLCTAVLIIPVTILVVFRLQITSFVVIQALERAGMTDIVFSPTSLNGHALVVSGFSCTLPSTRSHLTGNDLRITWDRSILDSKQVNTIVINTLKLDLAKDTPKSPPIPPQRRLAAIMRNLQKVRPSSFAPMLPFHKLQVAKLFFTGKNAGPLRDRQLSLELEKKKNTGNTENITARISLPREQLQLEATTSDFSTLVIQLDKTGRPSPLARAELTLHAGKITTRLKADLAGLSLVAPIPAADLPKINGQLSCTLILSWWENPHQDADMVASGVKPAEMGIGTETIHLQATVSCPEIHLQAGKTGLTITNISLGLLGDNTRISGNGAWKLNRLPGLFTLRFSHNLETGKGEAVIATSEPVLFSRERPLSAAVTGWPLPADLTGGELRVKSLLRWPPLRITARISLNNGRGFFKNIRFSGLATSQDLELLPALRSRSTGPLTIASVVAGIPIHNLGTEIELRPSAKPLPILILKNSHASLLGGKVANDYIHIDPQKTTLQTTIRVHDIHLADLLTLQQVKGLKVTGSVSGELPIRLDQEGLHVDSGRLYNEQAGGIIEYIPPGNNGLRDSPLTGYALKALEEFHYNLLTASAKYSPDGNLEVTLHLEGKSPKLDTKRPVHLNINTQQNLLSLVQSLRYSDSLTREIDREVQQHFQKKKIR